MNQAVSPEDQIIADLLSRMSPLEKAGQLMLVTFEGTDTDENAKITQLIKDYHIGGVVLSTAHENFYRPGTRTIYQGSDEFSAKYRF